MKRIALVMAFLLALPTVAPAAETMPDQLLRGTIEKIGVLLTADSAADPDDPRRLYAMIDFCEEVLPHIDFRGMARSVMGPAWREASAAQRARFVREFRYLLVRTYGAALHEKRGRKIVYLPFYGRPGDKTAVVRTEVRHAGGGANVQIGYSFYRAESIWKLYDITIDGVSLVTTYRRTYAETIDNKGLDALIADIARTNRQPARASGRAEDAGPKGRARK